MRLLILTALLAITVPALADNHGEQLGGIAETFSCTFNEGKGPEDIWSSAEFFNEQIDKIGSDDLSSYFAAVLLPFRASIDNGDYGWIGYWPDLNTMARGLDDYLTSKEGAAADERFLDVAVCKGNTWLRTPLLTNFPDEDNATPEADAVELHWCTLRDGATLTEVEAAEAEFVAVNGDAAIAVDRWTPFLANTTSDLVYLVAHEDLTSFGSWQTAWQTSETGQANGEAFNELMNCESGLFTGRVLRQGDVD